MKKLVYYLFEPALVALLFCLDVSAQNVHIKLADSTASEIKTAKRLVQVLEEYDVDRWIYTDTVVIADRSIPHSHPVLTLNTREQSDLSLLAVFLHENIHWYLANHDERTSKAIQDLKNVFNDVPVGSPLGARSLKSTYLHLLVCYLEYDALRQVISQRAANAIIRRKKIYTWIYEQVLQHETMLSELIHKHNLSPV